jgi:hypothetical protein
MCFIFVKPTAMLKKDFSSLPQVFRDRSCLESLQAIRFEICAILNTSSIGASANFHTPR